MIYLESKFWKAFTLSGSTNDIFLEDMWNFTYLYISIDLVLLLINIYPKKLLHKCSTVATKCFK